MSTVERKTATIDDLYQVEGKAELVGGEIVRMSPSGFAHLRIVGLIFDSLQKYRKKVGYGFAFSDGGGFLCQLPHRQSFSPDCGFYVGALPANASDFLPQPPLLAVEIRSKHDYGPRAEKAMAAKRADYFAAGTKAVWDVDPDGPVVVRLFLSNRPDEPICFRSGEVAHAEPVLTGWSFAVDAILEREK